MRIRLATVVTLYHNLNANIKNHDYWLLISNAGIKIQKALNRSIGLKNAGLFYHILGTSSLQNITKNTIIWHTPSNSISWLPSD
jgi:hypothetical protein